MYVYTHIYIYIYIEREICVGMHTIIYIYIYICRLGWAGGPPARDLREALMIAVARQVAAFKLI